MPLLFGCGHLDVRHQDVSRSDWIDQTVAKRTAQAPANDRMFDPHRHGITSEHATIALPPSSVRLFVLFLGRVDDLLLDVAGYGVVVRELHGEAALSAGDAG